MLESNTVLDDVNDEEKSDNDTSDNVKLIEKVNGEINSTDFEKVSRLLINLLLAPEKKTRVHALVLIRITYNL